MIHLLGFLGVLLGGNSVDSAVEPQVEEIVVTSERRAVPSLDHIGNIALVDGERVQDTGHAHIHELMSVVPGTWISRGSGQENLTAIRSPVLTGAGSCGAFLTLEDGIPTRPSGFCNVNQLFELQAESAAAVEVVRGPGNALYGSNALHGIINVLMPEPGPDTETQTSLELGSNDYRRVKLRAARASLLANLVVVDDGGFREDAGYRQLKLHAKHAGQLWDGSMTTALSVSALDQETAGFIVGEDAYKDDSLNRSNPNPEAFRKADSQRLYGIWQREFGAALLDLRPFLRRSDMEFLQHFLPGQPLEENGHVSAGVNAALSTGGDRVRTIVGADIEWADVFLRQSQDGPALGSAFLVETRPAGKHYDYDVSSVSLAPYVQTSVVLGERVELSAGLRAEVIRYDYDNRMLDGNTRDDGTACGFGGCLYSRPADRSDRFENLAPKLGLLFRASEDASVFVNLARGFRAPQMTELYRLQSGQSVSELDSETIDSVEVGLRWLQQRWRGEVAGFVMQKQDSVLRDAEGFNVSAGSSRHRGVEFSVEAEVGRRWSIRANGTLAKHTYDFDLVAQRGETFVSGRDVDTAPRWMGSVDVRFRPNRRVTTELQLNSIGKYFLDAGNAFTYPGHELLNFRVTADIDPRWQLSLRLRNLLDAEMADRADYAFGNFRYFPGRGREVFAELSYSAARN